MPEARLAPLRTEDNRRFLHGAVRRAGAPIGQGLLEWAFAASFDRLVYAQIWEDPVADLAALQLGPSDRLITIASGGCNVMSYLTANPASILAVDLNAHHLALTRLRLTAARHLPDWSSFFAFLGRADDPVNLERYRRFLSEHLDGADRAYWERRGASGRAPIGMLTSGLYRSGLLGRFIATAHVAARLHRVDLRGIVSQPTLAAQERWFDAEVAPIFARPWMRWLLARPAALFGLGIPPAQAALLSRNRTDELAEVLCARLRRLACEFPIRQNYFALQAFARSYAACEPAFLPPYLQRSNFEQVRSAADRVQFSHRSFTDTLAQMPDASLDAFVLLDAQDWMTDAQLDALWEAITRCATPGARVIFRTAARPSPLPGRLRAALLSRWAYDSAASAAGWNADRSAIYGGFHLYRKRSAD